MTDSGSHIGSSAFQRKFAELIDIMQQLRTPVTGCPWDLEQDFATIAPYTIEEAYEVSDAIQRGDMGDLCEELGDLLLQVVFHAQMASEQDAFTIENVIDAINTKMLRRHPHVFGGGADTQTAEEQITAWEVLKAAERQKKADKTADTSALAGVAAALPELMRAEKLQKRAARTGFDWTEAEQIFAKLDEEVDEVKEAIESEDRDAIEDEVGDMLFVCANLARRLDIDPEKALRRANLKFETRFRKMEDLSAQEDRDFSGLTLDEQEEMWTRVKRL